MNNNGIVIYAAGPIDLADNIPNWRQRLIELLKANHVSAVLFDPSTAFKIAGLGDEDDHRDQFIESANDHALKTADIMVAMMPATVPSVGTPIEINVAHEHGIPILLITNIPRGKSVYLNNRVCPQMWCWNKELNDEVLQAAVDRITAWINDR